MNIPALSEDLIKDFQQGRSTNLKLVEKTDALVTKIKKPFAYRLFRAGFSIFLELLLWAAMIACLVAIVFMERLYPFSTLQNINFNQPAANFTQKDFHLIVWTLRGLFLLLGVAFLWTASLLEKSRRKAKVRNQITKDMRDIMELLLHRRAAYEALTLKYPVDLAENNDTIAFPAESPKKDSGFKDVPLE